MNHVTMTFDSLSTNALRALVPVLLDSDNSQDRSMRTVRRLQARAVIETIERRTGWAERKLRELVE